MVACSPVCSSACIGGKQAFVQANSKGGTLRNAGMLHAMFWVLAVVSPVRIAVIMVAGLWKPA